MKKDIKFNDRIQKHWLGWTLFVGAVTASATWFIANEILVKPREYDISRLKGGVSALQQKLAQTTIAGSSGDTGDRYRCVSSTRKLDRNVSVTVREGEIKVQIKTPDPAVMHRHQVIEGTVYDPKATVYLLVRPCDATDYWVAEMANVKANGSWTAEPYFVGMDMKAGVNKFGILAVARKKADLQVGTKLHCLPPTSAVSSPVDFELF